MQCRMSEQGFESVNNFFLLLLLWNLVHSNEPYEQTNSLELI